MWKILSPFLFGTFHKHSHDFALHRFSESRENFCAKENFTFVVSIQWKFALNWENMTGCKKFIEKEVLMRERIFNKLPTCNFPFFNIKDLMNFTVSNFTQKHKNEKSRKFSYSLQESSRKPLFCVRKLYKLLINCGLKK